MDNRNKRVDISNLVDFHPVAPDHEFSPLLVNPNLNIELSSFSETFEELMSFPNYPEFAEEFAAKLDKLYIADGYSEETNINNMIVQLLILEGYISSDDLAQGSVIEKVNRETIENPGSITESGFSFYIRYIARIALESGIVSANSGDRRPGFHGLKSLSVIR